MDYVVGSVAALISGNVTPNRPKLVRRALTPIKHQPSPNVTPKSEFVDDRSIFLSPSVQKKKAIVKKSPKRIFQNPDLDLTQDSENNSSPKADKVKKHLKDDLESNDNIVNNKTVKEEVVTKDMGSPQSANEITLKKKKKKNLSLKSDQMKPSKEDLQNNDNIDNNIDNSPQNVNENTPKKKKNNLTPKADKMKKLSKEDDNNVNSPQSANENSPKKKKKRNSTVLEDSQQLEQDTEVTPKKKIKQKSADNNMNEVPSVQIAVKKSKKKHDKSEDLSENNVNAIPEENIQRKKKNKKKKKKATELESIKPEPKGKKAKKKLKNKITKSQTYVNPNAITSKDSDSEHESDNEIYSENEEANKEVLDTGPAEESSDEEDTPTQKKPENKEKSFVVSTEEEIKRTLFVGNVPLTKKCKKEIKNIFMKYGPIQTVRIRTVPVKDARVTPKVAVITNELHPDRTTVNVYVKFKNESSIEEALAENNRVLNGCHLRVTRSDVTGAEHDPRCAIFVGNVPFALEDDQLREKFERCGKVESVRIIRDKKTNAGKGFAYVNFASKDGVELALALTEEDLTIKNRILRVKRSTQVAQQQKSQDFGNKGFQGGNQTNNANNSFGKKVFKPRGQNQWQQSEGAQFQGRNQMNKPNTFGKKVFNPRGQNQEQISQGAQRRLMNKRKSQETGEGPAAKRKHLNQPQKEKKVRKEFVGMTAEKKKKNKFNKGQKKKRALSEILTKSKN